MCNHTAVAKAFVTTACTLAIGLLGIDMGGNSSGTRTQRPPTTLVSKRSLVPALCISAGRFCSVAQDLCCPGTKCIRDPKMGQAGGWCR